MAIEQLIFGNLLTNEDYGRKVIPFLKEEYFQDYSDKLAFNLVDEYVKKYNTFPTKEALIIDLSNVTTGSSDPEAFNTISFTKGFPSSSSQGVVRSTSLSWNASTNATRYEIEYEGSNDNFNWTTVQTFAASPYTTSTSQTAQWGSPQPAGGYGYYYFMIWEQMNIMIICLI